jgi:alpha-tubulin suppressor-like RCC1 family protein
LVSSLSAELVDGVALFEDIEFSKGGIKQMRAKLRDGDLHVDSDEFLIDARVGVAKNVVFFNHSENIPKGGDNTFSLKVLDELGEVVKDFEGDLALSSNAPITGLPSSLTFKKEHQGIFEKAFKTSLSRLGTYEITATSTSVPELTGKSDSSYVYEHRPFFLGKYHACIIINEKLKCWGSSDRGMLGNGIDGTHHIGIHPEDIGAIPFVDIDAVPVAVALGNYHSCVLTADLRVKCWGYNSSGHLGLGHTDRIGDEPNEMGTALQYAQTDPNRKVLKITASCNGTCVIYDDLNVVCWGQNTDGCLGTGDANNYGHSPEFLPKHLSGVSLGTNKKVFDIESGCTHHCVILDDYTVKCWGQNFVGALGSGVVGHRGSDPSLMGDNLPKADLGTNYRANKLAIGSGISCAILESGDVKCWGTNTGGRLGLGDTTHRGNDPAALGDNLLPVNLGSGHKAVSIGSGSGGSGFCALLENNEVKCWGYNTTGQLGIGLSGHRGALASDMGDNLPVVDLGTDAKVQSVQGNHHNACAYFKTGQVKCWGSGQWGIPMQGNTNNIGLNSSEMGIHLPFVDLD